MRAALHRACGLAVILYAIGACSLRSSLDDLTGAECVTNDDCVGPQLECEETVCLEGTCVVSFPSQKPVLSQAAGDCQVRVCDGAGGIVSELDGEDPFDDGKPCTQDTCNGSMLVNTPQAGENCELDGGAGGVCSDAGDCVECLGNDECVSADCTVGCVCQDQNCVPAHCLNGVVDGDETDLNCGGSCNPCGNGLTCMFTTDCESGVCEDIAGTCIGMAPCCQEPNCMDFVTNGGEAGPDCGAVCQVGCPDGSPCSGADDCLSGVCNGGCQPPNCGDLVKNGDESDVDCGGSDPKCRRCGPLEDCNVNSDCAGGQCRNPEGVCQPNCQDGVKNNAEVGIDCGGPDCLPCNDGGVMVPG